MKSVVAWILFVIYSWSSITSPGLAQELTCPAAELSSTAYLTCSFPWDFPIQIDSPDSSSVLCIDGTCIAADNRVNAIVINETYIALNITDVDIKDGGMWECGQSDVKTECNLVVFKTPSNCSITTNIGPNRLQEGEVINMSVSVSGYYCSEPVDFHLETGSETVEVGSDLVSEGGDTQNQFNISYKVSQNNIGDVQLGFTCDADTMRSLSCEGVRYTDLQTCNVTEVSHETPDLSVTVLAVNVDQQLSLGVHALSRECGHYTLYVGDNSHELLQGTEYLETGIISFKTTFNVTFNDIGDIHLLYQCEDVRRNISCDGLRSLELRITGSEDTSESNTGVIVVGVVGAGVAMIGLAVTFFLVRRHRHGKSGPGCHRGSESNDRMPVEGEGHAAPVRNTYDTLGLTEQAPYSQLPPRVYENTNGAPSSQLSNYEEFQQRTDVPYETMDGHEYHYVN